MPRLILTSLILLVMALFSPLIFLPRDDIDIYDPLPQETFTSESIPWKSDSNTYFTLLTDDGVYTTTMAEHMTGAIAAEMPALFETEALKAQAVAIRTYILRSRAVGNPRHPQADVCINPDCCKAWASPDELTEKWGESYMENQRRIASAAAETDGQYLSYNGEIIQAVFHASSAGKTEASGGIWSDEPYLISVDSPETAENVENLITEVRFTPEKLRSLIQSARPEADIPAEISEWLGELSYTASGRVSEIVLCGQNFTGTQLRQCLGLRSTDFDVCFNGEQFRFTVRGYGHGVGMSQHGANLLAEEGMDYTEILAHYYPGTELVIP